MTKQLTQHFSFEELTTTSHSNLLAENRTLAEQEPVLSNLTDLAVSILEKVRLKLGVPIKVNSGYRSPAVNKAVKGAKASDHLTGRAADITLGSAQKNKLLFDTLVKMAEDKEIEIGQLILEQPGSSSWVHVSTPTKTRKGQIMKYDGKKYTLIKQL